MCVPRERFCTCREGGGEINIHTCRHGHRFFVEGGGAEFFSCVNGSKMAIGEVMFFAAVAGVKRG